jgi:hypothetical protein
MQVISDKGAIAIGYLVALTIVLGFWGLLLSDRTLLVLLCFGTFAFTGLIAVLSRRKQRVDGSLGTAGRHIVLTVKLGIIGLLFAAVFRLAT